MTCSIDTCDCGDSLASQFISKLVKASKERICSECQRPIPKGEEYESVTGRWDGEKGRHHTCRLCLEIRDEFFDSWVYGAIWEDMRNECQEEEIGIGQLDRLSPEAVGLLEFMMEDEWEERWEEDQDEDQDS